MVVTVWEYKVRVDFLDLSKSIDFQYLAYSKHFGTLPDHLEKKNVNIG